VFFKAKITPFDLSFMNSILLDLSIAKAGVWQWNLGL